MRLIVNGDDLGYSPAVNRAILDLHDGGQLDSTSMIVNLPHSAAGMEAALARPELKVGVHLNLTRGRPCSAAAHVPSLLTPAGHFHATPVFFQRALLGRIDMAEAGRELRAQIELALAAGHSLAHLDSHSHWHILPSFKRLVFQLAAEYQAPRVRTVNVRRTLLPKLLLAAAVDRLSAAGDSPAESDYLFSLHQWMRGAGQVSPMLFSRQMKRLLDRPGVTAELVVHPGYARDPDFPADTLPAERRQWELEFIQSAQFTDWLAAVGAQLA